MIATINVSRAKSSVYVIIAITRCDWKVQGHHSFRLDLKGAKTPFSKERSNRHRFGVPLGRISTTPIVSLNSTNVNMKQNLLFNTTNTKYRVLWQAAQVLFVIATLIFAFLDGLFFHKIRMQGIRKRAAQKAAQTRKRNAPYKPSKRSRHYNLK